MIRLIPTKELTYKFRIAFFSNEWKIYVSCLVGLSCFNPFRYPIIVHTFQLWNSAFVMVSWSLESQILSYWHLDFASIINRDSEIIYIYRRRQKIFFDLVRLLLNIGWPYAVITGPPYWQSIWDKPASCLTRH